MSRLQQSWIRGALSVLLVLVVLVALPTSGCQSGTDETITDPNNGSDLPKEPENTQTVVLNNESGGVLIARAIMAAIEKLPDGGTVYVTGRTDEIVTTIGLNIPANITVDWQATCKTMYSNNLMNLNGQGTFILSTGGELASAGAGIFVLESARDLDIIIDGGTIYAQGFYAIASNGSNCRINLISGNLAANGAEQVCAITVFNGDVKIEGGLVLAAGLESTAVFIHNGKLTISDGAVTAEGVDCRAVLAIESEVFVSGGQISTSQDISSALILARSIAAISGGLISTTGNDAISLYLLDSECLISDGQIKASGRASDALGVDDYSTASIVGGVITSSGDEGHSVFVILGIVAYLRGTVGEEIDIAETEELSSLHSLIIEVDTLSVASSRNQTNDGLRAIAMAALDVDEVGFYWDIAQQLVKIVVVYQELAADEMKFELVWATWSVAN